MTEPLSDADLALLTRIGVANEWLRSLLCTLARRGTWLRQNDSDRASALLASLAAWPAYKAGQFLFDLLEWEDFMVDGPQPEVLPGALDAASLGRASALLRRLAGLLDGAAVGSTAEQYPDPAVAGQAPVGVALDALPELEPGFYLYQDVVLGVVLSVEADTDRGPAAPFD